MYCALSFSLTCTVIVFSSLQVASPIVASVRLYKFVYARRLKNVEPQYIQAFAEVDEISPRGSVSFLEPNPIDTQTIIISNLCRLAYNKSLYFVDRYSELLSISLFNTLEYTEEIR